MSIRELAGLSLPRRGLTRLPLSIGGLRLSIGVLTVLPLPIRGLTRVPLSKGGLTVLPLPIRGFTRLPLSIGGLTWLLLSVDSPQKVYIRQSKRLEIFSFKHLKKTPHGIRRPQEALYWQQSFRILQSEDFCRSRRTICGFQQRPYIMSNSFKFLR